MGPLSRNSIFDEVSHILYEHICLCHYSVITRYHHLNSKGLPLAIFYEPAYILFNFARPLFKIADHPSKGAGEDVIYM